MNVAKAKRFGNIFLNIRAFIILDLIDLFFIALWILQAFTRGATRQRGLLWYIRQSSLRILTIFQTILVSSSVPCFLHEASTYLCYRIVPKASYYSQSVGHAPMLVNKSPVHMTTKKEPC